MGWVALGRLSLGKLLGDDTGGFLDRGLHTHVDLPGRGLLGRFVGDEGGLLDGGLRVHVDLLGGGLLDILTGDGGGGLRDDLLRYDLLRRDVLGNFLGDGGGGLLVGRLSIHGALRGRGLFIEGLHLPWPLKDSTRFLRRLVF